MLTCVPTSTWTMTAAGFPVTCAYPCAALSATISFGHVTISRRAFPPLSERCRSRSSSIAGWSLPQLAKMWVMPASESVFKNTDDVVYRGRFDSERLSVGEVGVVGAVSEDDELSEDEDIAKKVGIMLSRW